MSNQRVDQTALKFNQASIITLLAVGFVLNVWPLVTFVAVVMAVGTLAPAAGLFKRFYQQVLQPAGLLRPQVIADDPRAHLFAQGVGALFLLASTLAFVSGAALAGWILAGIVVVLAAVNLFAGFCLGCFMYYQLARRGVHANLPWWQTA